jgi:hypothetical protein
MFLMIAGALALQLAALAQAGSAPTPSTTASAPPVPSGPAASSITTPTAPIATPAVAPAATAAPGITPPGPAVPSSSPVSPSTTAISSITPAATPAPLATPIAGDASPGAASAATWSEPIPAHTSTPGPPDTIFRKAGYGALAVVANVGYVPAKAGYAMLGGLIGGLTWAMTAGKNMKHARFVWQESMGGDYLLTPSMLEGKEPIKFNGLSGTVVDPGLMPREQQIAQAEESPTVTPSATPTPAPTPGQKKRPWWHF